MTTNAERFDRYVDKSDCWEWTGGRLNSGYGLFSWHDGQRRRARTAHRCAYELAHGPIPDGMKVLHTCDNRGCVRPDHLYLGTHAQNMTDMTERGRAATGDRNAARLYPERWQRGDDHHARRQPERMARGEANGNAKVTADVVVAMRARHAQGALLREMAAEFGCHLTTVHRIVTRATWRHV